MPELTPTLPPASDESTVWSPAHRRAIELAWHEADILDRKDYHSWEALYTEDGLYIVPIETPVDDDYAGALNMVYDDARMRRLRVARMTEGFAIAVTDSAKTVRTVSRFIPVSVDPAAGGVLVRIRAAQIIIAYKRDRHDIWAGEVDLTVFVSDTGSQADRIARKVVKLVDSEDSVPAAGFLL